MAEPKEPIKLNIAERDDLADLLGLIPQWVFGALFWVGASELVLKRLYPDDFIKLQTAVLGADVVGDMPPGVAMVAVMYDTLHAVEASALFWETFGKTVETVGEDPTFGKLFKLLTFQWRDLV